MKLPPMSLSVVERKVAAKIRVEVESFIIGNAKVIPNLSGVYKKGQDVGVYMQIYNAGIDQTTLRPAVDVEYILTKGGKEVLRQPENWEGLSDSGQRLTLARLLNTKQMPIGDYELKIRVKDRTKEKNNTIEQSAKFTITQ
jgi:5-hydroxyisourate hydrolase-like protein (transthyretin family)